VFVRCQDEDFFSPTLVLFLALGLLGVVFAEEDLGVDEVVEVDGDGLEHVVVLVVVDEVIIAFFSDFVKQIMQLFFKKEEEPFRTPLPISTTMNNKKVLCY
jgi:hypothetical protein